MSKDNVELMRAGIERFNRGGEDDALLDDLYDADAVFHSRVDEPDTGVYLGREAIRGMMRVTYAGFEFRCGWGIRVAVVELGVIVCFLLLVLWALAPLRGL
jgi:hypothetical protein